MKSCEQDALGDTESSTGSTLTGSCWMVKDLEHETASPGILTASPRSESPEQRPDSAYFDTSLIEERRKGSADRRRGKEIWFKSRNAFVSPQSSQGRVYHSIENHSLDGAFFGSLDNFAEEGIYSGERMRFERHDWEQLVADFERIAMQLVISVAKFENRARTLPPNSTIMMLCRELCTDVLPRLSQAIFEIRVTLDRSLGPDLTVVFRSLMKRWFLRITRDLAFNRDPTLTKIRVI
ncbi:hypothetical protein SCHPADRAFT_244372 [Schizopora paradoxa]|uniref:Uncharacterized protein n=1 Tax=Schizopora paradoxa TaxID=27342 RepID=A0A0H2SFD9_9AGAM|nr:hypothetical protein SCHPADRAFT_244372 [Schizopora paradoxa]